MLFLGISDFSDTVTDVLERAPQRRSLPYGDFTAFRGKRTHLSLPGTFNLYKK